MTDLPIQDMPRECYLFEYRVLLCCVLDGQPIYLWQILMLLIALLTHVWCCNRATHDVTHRSILLHAAPSLRPQLRG